MRYREAFVLLEELADAALDGTRKDYLADLTAVPLLIVDDLGMRKLPLSAAEDLLEVIMRRHERASTILTSNRPVEDWGKLLGDTPTVTAMLDRLLHHGHTLKCGPRSWRIKDHTSLRKDDRITVDTIGLAHRLWPLLSCRRLAGFQVSTEALPRRLANTELDGPEPPCRSGAP